MRQHFVCAVLGVSASVLSGQTPTVSYSFSTLAGRASSSGTTDGISPNARFNRPWGVTVDAAGNVYVADAGNYTVRKISPEGVVTTLAGQAGTSGTRDGTGDAAQFGTIAGTPPPSGTAVAGPFGLAVDAGGNVSVADAHSHTLRRVTPAGLVSTLTGVAGVNGHVDGPIASARFRVPYGITVDSTGVLYVADNYNHVIRRITTSGVVSTIAGSVGNWGTTDGIGAAARFLHPTAIAIDPAGNLYVTDCSNTVRRIFPLSPAQDLWETTTLAGSPGTYGSSDGTGSAARFGAAPTVSQTPGSITVRQAASSPGLMPTFTGYSYAIGELPGIAADAAGNVYVTDHPNNTIRKISPGGVVTTIGGSAVGGATDGLGTNARFSRPTGIAIDAVGNLYIGDSNHTVRKGTPVMEPSILTQPTDQIVGIGGSITLMVKAAGSPAPTYQWRRNGISVAGATSATLALANVQSAQAGIYTVTATNAFGAATSSGATLIVTNSPVITVHPVGQIVSGGQTVTLSVGAGGSPFPAFQWLRDGVPIPGATTATLVLTNVQTSVAGDYSVVASNSVGIDTSKIARVAVNTARIVNLSIRSALTGSEQLIVGFVAAGGPKPLLVRAIGPSLRGFGVASAMSDPQLTLSTASSVLATNDNWGTGPAVAQVTLATTQVGAFTLAADSLDAAVLTTAIDDGMTAQTSARNSVGGIVLVELYDTTPAAASRLVNVSARAKVGAGEDALFAGFVVTGNAARTLLIRAIGPTLGAFGVNGTLADPRLDIFASGAAVPLASNDNWSGNAVLASTFQAVSAFTLPAADSRDAALLVSLEPGAYTAQVSGVGGLTGEVLLEIYEVP